MAKKRIIARLDIKKDRLIKGMHLEGWRFLPNTPNDYAKKYYEEGIDEIVYIDAIASLYSKETLLNIIENTTNNVFVPITAGGGIKSVQDATEVLRSGADKIAINSAAIQNENLITEVSSKYGKQCVVLSIQAKSNKKGSWDAYYDVARENSGLDVIEWAKKAEKLGAGEIILTSIDREGTRKGFDYELIKEVASAVEIPLIASGGFGEPQHALEAFKSGAEAVAIAYNLHYQKTSVHSLKEFLTENGIDIRMPSNGEFN